MSAPTPPDSRIRPALAAVARAIGDGGRSEGQEAFFAGVNHMADAAADLFASWLRVRDTTVDSAIAEVLGCRAELITAKAETRKLLTLLSFTSGQENYGGTPAFRALVDAHHAQALAEQETERLRDAVHEGWGVIANAGDGSWDRESSDWREAAERWRDTYVNVSGDVV